MDDKILEFLNSHTSCRKFSGKEISKEAEQIIIKTAQRSATSSNLHAYSIVGVRNQEKKNKLATLCGNQSHVAKSSLFLIFLADLHRLKRINENKGYDFNGNWTELFILATVDVSLVACRALQAAQAMDMGGVMVGGIRTNIEEVSQMLNLPDFTYPVMGMSLGYPEDTPKLKPRLPIDAVYFQEEYNAEQMDPAIKEYDEIIAELDYMKGREVDPDEYPNFSGRYSWIEHTARRMASKQKYAYRPHMKEYLEKRGFIQK